MRVSKSNTAFVGKGNSAKPVNGHKNVQSSARLRGTPEGMIGRHGSGLKGPNTNGICDTKR